MRELDTEADFYLGWFMATHHVTEHGWVMSHLPWAGSFGAQDALLMQGLAFARDEANDYLREQQTERQREHQAAQHFARVEQEARA